jgi:formamidopyrimidine-DNA glycosylase
MPELPEVETVRRGLAPVMVGARVVKAEVRRSDIRSPFPHGFRERLLGRRFEALSRRGKYLLFQLDSGETLLAHLGMSGSFRIEAEGDSTPGAFHFERSKDSKHDHVVLHLDNGKIVSYNDPRRFGLMDLVRSDALEADRRLSALGDEPIAPEFNAARLAELFAGSRTPLKSALLDQRRIAGLGNIYACEALFLARLSPKHPASVLVSANGKPTRAAVALARGIHQVLGKAIEAGGSTLRDHRQANGELGYFQHRFKVYDREGLPCMRKGCRGTIARIAQAGRSTFYCSTCQR